MEDLVNEDNPNYCSIDGVLYSKDKTKLILYPTGKKGNYMILNGTKTIATGAFQYCINLTSVSIPNSLTKIETDAFNGSSLKYIIYLRLLLQLEIMFFTIAHPLKQL